MNKDKRQFDKTEIKYIISEYLGIDKETFIEFFDTALINDIHNIINKYKEDKRDIEYMLENDYICGYASDNCTYDKDIKKLYKDLKYIEKINGIAIFQKLG